MLSFASFFSVFRGRIISSPCPDGKNNLLVCSSLIVTPLDFPVCVEGGTRGSETPSPPHRLADHWALFTAGPLIQSEWNPEGSEVILGLLWTIERRWGLGWGCPDLGVSMASLSGHVCPLPPSARTYTQKQTDTHWPCLLHVSDLSTS